MSPQTLCIKHKFVLFCSLTFCMCHGVVEAIALCCMQHVKVDILLLRSVGYSRPVPGRSE